MCTSSLECEPDDVCGDVSSPCDVASGFVARCTLLGEGGLEEGTREVEEEEREDEERVEEREGRELEEARDVEESVEEREER